MSIFTQIAQKRGVRLFSFLVLLTSVSFALGYGVAKNQNPAPIIIQKIEACEKYL